jgi:sec-independent protein translocase protein TatA
MGFTSIWHWIILAMVIILLFGRGKISDLMGDVAKGIKSFKKGMADDEPEVSQKTTAQMLELEAQTRHAEAAQSGVLPKEERKAG